MPPVRPRRDLKELPKFRDGWSYLYVEHAVIEQEARAIAVYDTRGMTLVPAAALAVLFLGPGTRITHAAIRTLADNGCAVCWVGEGLGRFYAQGLGETHSAARVLRQARAWADPALHLEVVRRLYRFRLPSTVPPNLSLAQLRGLEGVRVRAAYAEWSRRTGVPWQGRSYQRQSWTAADPANRALSAGAAFLYGLAHAAIVSSGYSPALGFIHTGKLLSFVYDVADLYKTDVVVPAAFRVVAESERDIERRLRLALREQINESGLLARMVEDIHRLFTDLGPGEEGPDFDEDPARPGELWDPEGAVAGGVSYDCDDSRERPEELEG